MAGGMNVGFVGLGVMGLPMASHLVEAGHRVLGYNRSPAAAETLISRGAHGAESLAELAVRSDVVVTMLPDSPDVEEVLFAPNGIASKLGAGALVIDCSTISPQSATSIGARLAEADVAFVDAPVSGGEVGAVSGSLAVMMGGADADVVRAQEILGAFASTMAHVGPIGSGQLVKAANQILVAGNIAMVAEALTLLGRTNVDVRTALGVLNGGLAASRVLEVKGPKMVDRDFSPGFRLDLHYKDLKIALSAAERANVALPLTGIVTQLVQAMRSAGGGSLDHGALIQAVERLSSVVPKATGHHD